MTESRTSEQILMVDDESNVLDGYRRSLHDRFDLATVGSGAEGLVAVQAAVDAGAPYPVVVSDMMMPGMNGAEFLGQAALIDPTAIQLLLSGQADLESTISAVNKGNLFRFLTKPCTSADLSQALTAAMAQHRLVQAEKELLERTLGGAIGVLTELLSMASPEAFTRTERVRTLTTVAAETLDIHDWRLPLASMLSQIGCIAVPGDVLHRARAGGDLTDDERAIYLAHPETAQRLLSRIPRLEDVARWVGDQPVKSAEARATAIEPAELLLKAALEYLVALDDTGDPTRAMTRLVVQAYYPDDILGAVRAATAGLAPQGVLREVTVDEVRPGMLLEDDVETVTGMTLVRRGERITEALATRLSNFDRTVGVKVPIMVLDGV